MDGARPITPAVPQAGTNPRSSESAPRAPAPAAGILTLGRPQGGEVLTFDTNDYSLIDFAQITDQWAALVQVGVTLRVVFSEGSVIELLHFFSGLDLVAPAAEGETTGAATESSDETRVRTAAGGKVLSSEEFSRAFWVTKTSGDASVVSIVLPVSTVTTSIQTISFETIPFVPSRLPDLPLFVLPDAPPDVPFVPVPPPPPPPAANQPPVITTADADGNMTEDDTPPSADGTIEFTDADIADVHAATVVPPPLVYIGAFAAMVTQAATGGVVGQVTWTYLADAADLQFLAEGQHLIQTYTVTIDDGRGGIATQVVTIDIEGINDPAIISGDTTGGVVEAGGVANSIPGTPVATGDLDSTDVDNPDDTFTVVGAPTASANGYGTFVVTIFGIWSYTLDNTDAAVEALNVGDTLTDTFIVTTVDGTPQVVTITIDGANDAAIISGDTTGGVIEAGGVANSIPGTPVATGDLDSTDVDNPDDDFTVVGTPTISANGYGPFTVTTFGVWTYTLDNSNPAVEALNVGDTLTDTFNVTSVDGTAAVVTVTIDGADDAAVISGDTAGAVIEAGGAANSIPGTPVATGDLDSTDVDDPDDRFTVVGTPTASASGYGTFTMTVFGLWTYTLDNTNAVVEALNVGGVLIDTFTVTTVDGVAQAVTITIDGTNDDPVASPVTLASIQANSGARTITAAELLAGVTDADGPALSIASLAIASGLGTLIDNPDDTWSFTPAANDSTSVTFDFTATDGMALASSTAFLDILPVNTLPPSLDLDGNNSGGGGSDWTTTFRMGGPAIPIVDVDVTITDTDSTTIASATFTLRGNGQVPPNDILKINGTLPAGITASAYNATTGVLTLTGVASLAAYQTALRQVVFSTTNAFYNADRIISVTVNDGVHDSNTATSFVHVTSAFAGIGLTLTDDPVPLYAFALDAGSPNSISFDLTNLISGAASLDHVLVFYSPSESDPWAWLDQSASPVLSASATAITDANAGTYTALVFAGDDGVSAVSFTILGDAASEFDITVDAAGSGAGERDSGNRPIGDLIIVNDNIAGTVTAGGGDDVMWIRAGTGSHHLDGGDGDDALYGNAGNDTLDGGEGNNYLSGAGGIDVLTAGSGDDVLLGGAGDDQLSSGDGDDVLIGGIGNDTLNAGAGHDGLLGGAGNDVLTGGGGVDQFVFAETGATNVDQVTDYQAIDTINLSPLLDSTFTATDDPLDFVRLVQTGSDILVQVDVDGTAGSQTWVDVATLVGYGTGGADPVNVFFAGTGILLNA